MEVKEPFIIYNASAGSGKTFTLVKAYLKILFQSSQAHAFKNILALTFTNKAVAEMKTRVVDMLMAFSDEDILKKPTPMFSMLADELAVPPIALHQKSKQILENIAHNYASFDISTIDKFNHRLIRTFAHDLKLPLNFEVELDTTSILSKAVDHLIEQAGTDKALTKVLVDFALEKADEDKSWDVAFDFNQIATLLTSENHAPFIETLKDKTLVDFSNLKKSINSQTKNLSQAIKTVAQDALSLIEAQGLEPSDFSGGYLPKYFGNVIEEKYDVNLNAKWQTDLIDGGTIYPKSKISKDKIPIVEGLQPVLAQAFKTTKEYLFRLKFLKNCIKNITPLSVLNAIYNSLETIKQEEDLVLISEFNALISSEIKMQPAPFIYERIGEKFKHYFIDEFQDTSTKQWENLIPLVDNAISGQNVKGESGSAMLVGDAKQAIYRWRGGKAEQFIDLYTEQVYPFQIQQNVNNLPVNYRSLETIVNFNNSFFKHLSTFVFSNGYHQKIYEASHQQQSLKGKGYVELSFLELKDADKDEAYGQRVYEAILTAQDHYFQLRDMCIITRKRQQGTNLAQYLSARGIPIISSESLLLINSPEVQFMTSIIALASQPYNDMLKINILGYIADYQLKVSDKHSFFAEMVHLEASELFKQLKEYQLFFDFNQFLQLPFYEAVESIVRAFHLNRESNAYVQFFLDEVLDYSQQHAASLSDFMTHWETKQGSCSITSPQGHNAVQIMTIHKSKGLEFPVVIFPYADQDIYKEKSPKMWVPVNPDEYDGFSHMFINVNKELADMGEQASTLYSEYRSELELDNLNLLYVVLTRAVEQLYIISEYAVDKDKKEKLGLFSGLFINYLKSISLWKDGQNTYKIGEPARVLREKTSNEASIQIRFISVAKEKHDLRIVTNSGYLWDTDQEAAIEKGNLVHLIMSKITTVNDLDQVFNVLETNGHLSSQQTLKLKPVVNAIVHHKQLQELFLPGLKVYNEKAILTKAGLILRPDRIVLNNKGETFLVDYKTGAERPSHFNQLIQYQSVLEEMSFKVHKKILVYINMDIQVKEF